MKAFVATEQKPKRNWNWVQMVTLVLVSYLVAEHIYTQVKIWQLRSRVEKMGENWGRSHEANKG